MTRLTQACPQCARTMWCGRVACKGAPYVVAHMRERCGLPPLEPAKPVSNKPESVSNRAQSVSNKPAPVSNSVSNSVSNRLERWRTSNPERYRTYMREYMRRYRASKKKPAAT